MSEQVRKLIYERARVLGRILSLALQEYEKEECHQYEQAFKYCYLVLCRPKKFAEKFGLRDLSIAKDDVVDVFYDFRSNIPGDSELMPEEIEIINTHNSEVIVHLNSTNNLKLSTQLHLATRY